MESCWLRSSLCWCIPTIQRIKISSLFLSFPRHFILILCRLCVLLLAEINWAKWAAEPGSGQDRHCPACKQDCKNLPVQREISHRVSGHYGTNAVCQVLSIHTQSAVLEQFVSSLTVNFSDLPVSDRAVKYVQSCLLEAKLSVWGVANQFLTK